MASNERKMPGLKDVSIVWFRTGDLRVHDHEPLVAACEQRNATVIPLVLLQGDNDPYSRMSHRRMAINKAIISLEKALKERVGGLSLCLLQKKDWHQGLESLIGHAPGRTIDFHFYLSAHQSLDPWGFRMQEEVLAFLKEKAQGSKVRIHSYWGRTLYHPSDLISARQERKPSVPLYSIEGQYPGSLELIGSCRNMTHFRELCQGTLPVREPHKVPSITLEAHDEELYANMCSVSLKELDTTSRQIRPDIPVEEEEALEHLESLLHDDVYMSSYRTSRMAASTSERGVMLSTALSLGTISPRVIYQKVHERLRAKSTTWTWGPKVDASSLGEEWLLMHLVIRDYFIYLSEYEGEELYNFGNGRQWSQDKNAFNHWISGTTGFPFVDAHMRELHATGFISNRGRQNVASFLTKELGIDWRWGEEYFQKTLIDHDWGVNAESWAYVAGVGPGRRDTKFMTVTQGEKYDPDATSIARWIPELSHVDPPLRHRPWLSDQSQAYPAPIRPVESQIGKPQK